MASISGPIIGAVAGTALSAGVSAIKGSGQSSDISQGQEQANADLQPWVTSGTSANTLQANLLGLNGQDAADTAMKSFQASPGYQYSLDQGEKAVDAGAASKGMLRSGAVLKAEQTLGSNLADQDFGNYMTRLNGLSTLGQNSATGQAATDTSAAANQASIYGGAANGIGNSVGTGLTSPAVQNGLTSLFSGGSGGGWGSSDAVVSPAGSPAASGGIDAGVWGD